MRKYTKILWIGLLIVALQLSSISGVFVTYAADVSGQIAAQFIQGVDIKEKTGVLVGNTLIGKPDIDKETEFWL